MKLLSEFGVPVKLSDDENVELRPSETEPDVAESVTEIRDEFLAGENVGSPLPDDEVNGSAVDAVTVGTSTAEPTLETVPLGDVG